MTRGGIRECRVEAGEGDPWRQVRVTRGGRRECRVEVGESAAWRQERVPRGGRRGILGTTMYGLDTLPF